MKTIKNIHIFLFTQFDSTEPIQLLKTYEKMCISVTDFYMKIVKNKHTLLYNLPIIHSIQRYNGLWILIKYYLKQFVFTNMWLYVGKWKMLYATWFISSTLPYQLCEHHIIWLALTQCYSYSIMVFSFLQRKCHPLTRCVKKLLTNPVLM